jgi:hypothetical protein
VECSRYRPAHGACSASDPASRAPLSTALTRSCPCPPQSPNPRPSEPVRTAARRGGEEEVVAAAARGRGRRAAETWRAWGCCAGCRSWAGALPPRRLCSLTQSLNLCVGLVVRAPMSVRLIQFNTRSIRIYTYHLPELSGKEPLPFRADAHGIWRFRAYCYGGG